MWHNPTSKLNIPSVSVPLGLEGASIFLQGIERWTAQRISTERRVRLQSTPFHSPNSQLRLTDGPLCLVVQPTYTYTHACTVYNGTTNSQSVPTRTGCRGRHGEAGGVPAPALPG